MADVALTSSMMLLSICCYACRLSGRAAFREKQLKRHGRLVRISPPSPAATVRNVADYLEQELKAAAGGSLAAFRL